MASNSEVSSTKSLGSPLTEAVVSSPPIHDKISVSQPVKHDSPTNFTNQPLLSSPSSAGLAAPKFARSAETIPSGYSRQLPDSANTQEFQAQNKASNTARTPSGDSPAEAFVPRSDPSRDSELLAADEKTPTFAKISKVATQATTPNEKVGSNLLDSKATNVLPVARGSTPVSSASTNTRPKHKSPLGTQPPILASDTSKENQSSSNATSNACQLNHNLAATGFLEPHGILQQYVEHVASPLVEEALRRFHQERSSKEAGKFDYLLCLPSTVIDKVTISEVSRYYFLASHYVRRWRACVWRKQLNRRAGGRREHLAQSIRLENRRRADGEAEMKAIIAAQREKQEVQAEQFRRSLQGDGGGCGMVGSKVQLGQKRKSSPHNIADTPARDNLSGDSPQGHGHKRSKTIAETTTALPGPTVPTKRILARSFLQPGSEPHPRRTASMRDGVRADFKQSVVGSSRDSTRTDYFRLKALGINPNTPLFADAKPDSHRRRSGTMAERKKTPSIGSALGSGGKDTVLQSHDRPSKYDKTASLRVKSSSSPIDTPSHLLDDDAAFLQEVRDVQAAMLTEMSWFKDQAAQMEREGQQHGGVGDPPTRGSPLSDATNAHARQTEGPEAKRYTLCGVEPTRYSSLSRTEQRIRATGAHGLATKSVSDYLPVAMSKSSRARLEQNTSFTPEYQFNDSTKQYQRPEIHVAACDPAGKNNDAGRTKALISETGTGTQTKWNKQGGIHRKKRPSKKRRREKDGTYVYQSGEDEVSDNVDTYLPNHKPEVSNSASRNHKSKPRLRRFPARSNVPEKTVKGVTALTSFHRHANANGHGVDMFPTSKYDETDCQEELTGERLDAAKTDHNGDLNGQREDETEEPVEPRGQVESEESFNEINIREEEFNQETDVKIVERDEEGEEIEEQSIAQSIFSGDAISEENSYESSLETGSLALGDDDNEDSEERKPLFHMRLRSASPDWSATSRHSSEQRETKPSVQATSGSGVSADDALVLSD